MIERLINPRSDEDTHKTLPQLSRGTAEQLYLALRFGYIRDYATSIGTGLNLIIWGIK